MAAINITPPSAPLTSWPISPAIAAPVDTNPAHPFFGHGGSYRFDPATGKTTLIERAGEDVATSTEEPAPAAPSSTPAQE